MGMAQYVPEIFNTELFQGWARENNVSSITLMNGVDVYEGRDLLKTPLYKGKLNQEIALTEYKFNSKGKIIKGIASRTRVIGDVHEQNSELIIDLLKLGVRDHDTIPSPNYVSKKRKIEGVQLFDVRKYPRDSLGATLQYEYAVLDLVEFDKGFAYKRRTFVPTKENWFTMYRRVQEFVSLNDTVSQFRVTSPIQELHSPYRLTPNVSSRNPSDVYMWKTVFGADSVINKPYYFLKSTREIEIKEGLEKFEMSSCCRGEVNLKARDKVFSEIYNASTKMASYTHFEYVQLDSLTTKKRWFDDNKRLIVSGNKKKRKEIVYDVHASVNEYYWLYYGDDCDLTMGYNCWYYSETDYPLDSIPIGDEELTISKVELKKWENGIVKEKRVSYYNLEDGNWVLKSVESFNKVGRITKARFNFKDQCYTPLQMLEDKPSKSFPIIENENYHLKKIIYTYDEDGRLKEWDCKHKGRESDYIITMEHYLRDNYKMTNFKKN